MTGIGSTISSKHMFRQKPVEILLRSGKQNDKDDKRECSFYRRNDWHYYMLNVPNKEAKAKHHKKIQYANGSW